MQKESVELFAYPHRGSDKTLVQISKSPHLAVYIGMIYSYTNEECLSCLLPYLLKLSDFYVRVNAKHFHVTNMLVTYSVTTQRQKMFLKDRTLYGNLLRFYCAKFLKTKFLSNSREYGIETLLVVSWVNRSRKFLVLRRPCKSPARWIVCPTRSNRIPR